MVKLNEDRKYACYQRTVFGCMGFLLLPFVVATGFYLHLRVSENNGLVMFSKRIEGIGAPDKSQAIAKYSGIWTRGEAMLPTFFSAVLYRAPGEGFVRERIEEYYRPVIIDAPECAMDERPVPSVFFYERKEFNVHEETGLSSRGFENHLLFEHIAKDYTQYSYYAVYISCADPCHIYCEL